MTEYNGEAAPYVRPSENPDAKDYFSFGGEEKFFLPDGIQWIKFKVMNEGDRAKYQRMTRRDLVMQKSGDARLGVDVADDRHALIMCAVTGWEMRRGNNTAVFNDIALRDFLQLANPVIIDDLERAIRKANKWLLGSLTVEEIDSQIRDLEEQRRDLVAKSEGESSSSSK